MTASGRTLFLHIGPAKTGSSAIQHVLRGRAWSTLLYPATGQWWDGAHHNLVFNFFGEGRPDITPADADELFAAVGRETANSQADILISSEALWGRDIGAFLQRLLPHLTGIARVEVIVVCREHLALIASLYNQMVKDAYFLERRAPDDYLLQESPLFVYAPGIEALSVGPYPVRLLNYHPAQDLVGRFLAHVGLAAPDDGSPPRNISLSIMGMVAVLGANRTAPTPDIRARLYQALESQPGFFASGSAIFSAAAVDAVFPGIAADRAWLAQRQGITLPAPRPAPAQSLFAISPAERDMIAAVMMPQGAPGTALIQALEPFVRSPA